MKRFAYALFVWTYLCFVGAVYAQIALPWPGPGAATNGGSGGSCSQSTAWFGRVTGLSGTEHSAYDTLICGLVTDGTYASMDALYIFATNTTTTAKLNLISTNYSATYHGTPAESAQFVADKGYTGDGSTVFLDTGFNPSTATSPNYVLNSGALGVYMVNNRATVDSSCTTYEGSEIGANASFTNDYGTILLDNCAQSFNSGVNDVNTTFAGGFNASIGGGWAASRTSSTTSVLYFNGNAWNSSGGGASTAVPQGSMYILAVNNNNGTSANFTPDSISAAFIGGGLTSAQVATVQSRIRAYMVAFNIQIDIATLNPSDKSANITLSGGNLTATASASVVSGVRATSSRSTGLYYFEAHPTTLAAGDFIGFANSTFTLSNNLGSDANSVGLAMTTGVVTVNGATVGTTCGSLTGNRIYVALDLTHKTIWFRPDTCGSWNNNSGNPTTNTGGFSVSGLNAGAYFPTVTLANSGDVMSINFGSASYALAPPPASFANWVVP